jgi:hypothetical protein
LVEPVSATPTIAIRFLAGESEKLPALLPDLVEFTLSPYLSVERAVELAAEARTA